jgi:hypothetical protein
MQKSIGVTFVWNAFELRCAAPGRARCCVSMAAGVTSRTCVAQMNELEVSEKIAGVSGATET